jgi:hypothetical protein
MAPASEAAAVFVVDGSPRMRHAWATGEQGYVSALLRCVFDSFRVHPRPSGGHTHSL